MRCLASPHHPLLAENLGKPSPWVIINAPWYYLHPRPQPDYRAVVGGLVSDQRVPDTYVAALRLVCPDSVGIACWRLEKFAINREIILDRGEPL